MTSAEHIDDDSNPVARGTWHGVRGTGLAMSRRQQIETDGYAVVPGVLSPEDTAHLRRMLLEHFRLGGTRQGLGNYQGAAAATVPGLDRILCHPGLLAAFRELLGDGPLVFTGSSDLHLNVLNTWHRDSSALGKDAWSGDYFTRDGCRVYRACIYLQDHDKDGLGLNVRRGSHLRPGPDGPLVTLGNRKGDIAFIDSRVLHAGVLPDPVENLMRGIGRRLGEPAWLAAIKDGWWRGSGKCERAALFLGYGLRSPEVEEFCRFDLLLRRRRVGGDRCLMRPALLAALEAAGVLTYETELIRRHGDGVLRAFAARGALPEERFWS